jgi:hypothetical protein
LALQALFHEVMTDLTIDSVLATCAGSEAAAGVVAGDAAVDGVVELTVLPLLGEPPQATSASAASTTSSASMIAAPASLNPRCPSMTSPFPSGPLDLKPAGSPAARGRG